MQQAFFRPILALSQHQEIELGPPSRQFNMKQISGDFPIPSSSLSFNIRLIQPNQLCKLKKTSFTFSLVTAASLQFSAYAYFHRDVSAEEAFQFTVSDVRGYDQFFYKNGFLEGLDLSKHLNMAAVAFGFLLKTDLSTNAH